MRAATIVCAVLLFTASASADTVTLTSSSAPDGRATITGTILDYTGREIVIELASGNPQKYPAERVVAIETTFNPQQQAADRLFAEGQYAAALAKYREAGAGSNENRRWVRRQMLARMVECHQALGQYAQAGDFFLLLIKDDPQTLHFASIPLPWLAVEMTPPLEQKAQQWLTTEGQPIAQLLGASFLLLTSKQSSPLAMLKQLATSKDPQLSSLAEAQSWRATVASTSVEQLAAWNRRIESFPSELGAGPYFIVGRALSNRGKHEEAALALMHVPILYPQSRPLAAESLWLAGQALARRGDGVESRLLFRELVTRYPESPSAETARASLETTTTPAVP